MPAPCFLMSHFRKFFPLQTAVLYFFLLTFDNCVAVLHLEVLTMVITCPVYSVLSINKACAISAAAIFLQERGAYVNVLMQTGGLSFSRWGWGGDLQTIERTEENSSCVKNIVSRYT